MERLISMLKTRRTFVRNINWFVRWSGYDKIKFCESDIPGKSQWRTPTYFEDGSFIVMVGCPKCAKPISIESPQHHEIDWYGVVHPSCVCPYKCGYHSWMVLERWEDRKRPGEDGVEVRKIEVVEPKIILPYEQSFMHDFLLYD